MALLTGVLTISDGCARGEREDVSGRILADALSAAGHTVVGPIIIRDDEDAIVAQLLALCRSGCNLVLTTGGTGFSPRDVTPEATRRIIERDAPGLAELLRREGYAKLDRAVLSRGLSGIVGSTLIVNLPGSPSGARDGIELLLPLLPHACALLRDEAVDHTGGRGDGETGRRGEEGQEQGQGQQQEHGQRQGQVPPTAASSYLGAAGNLGLGELGKLQVGHSDDVSPSPTLPLSHSPSPPLPLSLSPTPPLSPSPPPLVDVIETNIDDLNPEFYELLMSRLFDAGAVDVYLTAIQMKKQRPATLLTVLAPPIKREEIAAVVFAETGSLGLRYTTMNRMTLQRRWESVETQYGAIRIKIGSWRGAETAASPEYEDVKAAAKAHNVPPKTVYAAAVHEYLTQSHKGADSLAPTGFASLNTKDAKTT